MKKIIFFEMLSIILISFGASAQNNKPYTEGPVWMVQFIQTKPGMNQLYLNNLNEGWIKEMKQAKTEGLIMDYKVLSGVPGSKNDWDLMLLFEIKNYAALDGMTEKMEAIGNKIFGTEETQHKAALSRNDLRDLLGGKLTRELIYK